MAEAVMVLGSTDGPSLACASPPTTTAAVERSAAPGVGDTAGSRGGPVGDVDGDDLAAHDAGVVVGLLDGVLDGLLAGLALNLGAGGRGEAPLGRRDGDVGHGGQLPRRVGQQRHVAKHDLEGAAGVVGEAQVAPLVVGPDPLVLGLRMRAHRRRREGRDARVRVRRGAAVDALGLAGVGPEFRGQVGRGLAHGVGRLRLRLAALGDLDVQNPRSAVRKTEPLPSTWILSCGNMVKGNGSCANYEEAEVTRRLAVSG
ncbi:hypothetical protein PG996_001490 [Apiospora saccharicola]|uniref:Uncharacterized protein n=1 Tax=Apiospora saccharicola TaxID=335842 RepID=A0ABR1WGS2_9PEZI